MAIVRLLMLLLLLGTIYETGSVNFDAVNVEFHVTYGHVHVTAVAAAGNHHVGAKST